jgi:hypothetical protein
LQFAFFNAQLLLQLFLEDRLMLLRCPVCKADNTSGPACRRCKADLSLLFALEERRDGLLVEARAAVAAGQLALPAAMEADALRRDEESLRLVALAALLCRDFHLAWRTYTTLKESATQSAARA